jgi:hypothetical protein
MNDDRALKAAGFKRTRIGCVFARGSVSIALGPSCLAHHTGSGAIAHGSAPRVALAALSETLAIAGLEAERREVNEALDALRNEQARQNVRARMRGGLHE